MARVLLIGRGPLPASGQHHTGFAQLRTRHFLQALEGADHSVDLLLITDDHAPGLLDTARARAQSADVVVSAGPHRPASVAVAAAAADQPIWLDLPGDPLAELQALAIAPGSALSPARRAEAHAMARSALSRADHLSVISTPQHHAAIGQLSLLGRIDDTLPPISVIPIAYDFPFPAQPARPIPDSGPVVLALTGAFAPWFDDETLAEALQIALEACPRLHVCVTGGGVEGHYTAGAARFQQWAESSSMTDRIQWHGWVPHGQVPALLGAAHIGICLDRPGSEPMLGSRTRVLLFAWLGLHIVASPTTELVSELAARDLCTTVPSGADRDTLAGILRSLVDQPPPLAARPTLHPYLQERYGPHAITPDLLRFVAEPTRLPPADDPVALVTTALETVRADLASVHGSWTWRVLSKIHRLFKGGS